MALREADKKDRNNSYVLELLDKSHLEGDIRGSYARAACYVDGKYNSEINRKKAIRIFKSLQNSDLPEAIFSVAYLYDVGDSVSVDKNKAFSLYMRSALLGHREACRQVAEFYREGASVLRDPKLARAWNKRARSDEESISPIYRIWLR
jgi:TPR repeat protein